MKKSKNSKSNKMLYIGISLIAVSLLIFGGVLFSILKGDNEETMTPGNFAAVGQEDSATACQNLLSDYYSAIMSGDGESLYKLMAPPEYWNYYMENYSKTEKEIIETYLDAAKNTKATWMAKCGDDAKVSFQIISSVEEPEEFLKNWNDNVGSLNKTDKLVAEEALNLNVKQTVTGMNGTYQTENSPIVIKINGKWYILDEGIKN
ncbi:MAG: hypothetical protein K2H01_11810 [Ruminococcus sp.]|nr:hypothetical protein [Ruminococcus sp.]